MGPQPGEKTIEQQVHEKNVKDYLAEIAPIQEKYNVRSIAIIEYLPDGIRPVIIYVDKARHEQMIKNLQQKQ